MNKHGERVLLGGVVSQGGEQCFTSEEDATRDTAHVTSASFGEAKRI
jgi:hypothetical protein